MAFCCCNTKLGKIYIAERDNHIVRLAFSYNALFDTEEQVNTPLLENACAQINEYFAGQRKSFNLKVPLPKRERKSFYAQCQLYRKSSRFGRCNH